MSVLLHARPKLTDAEFIRIIEVIENKFLDYFSQIAINGWFIACSTKGIENTKINKFQTYIFVLILLIMAFPKSAMQNWQISWDEKLVATSVNQWLSWRRDVRVCLFRASLEAFTTTPLPLFILIPWFFSVFWYWLRGIFFCDCLYTYIVLCCALNLYL